MGCEREEGEGVCERLGEEQDLENNMLAVIISHPQNPSKIETINPKTENDL